MTDEKETRNTLALIEANIERAEMRRGWRNIDDNTIEEYIEFWIKREREAERKGVEQSSDNS